MSDSRDRPSMLAMIVGGGIGVTWVALALLSLWSAIQGFIQGRLDWGVGWGLVGVLLLAAGCAALIGTWWHQTRVLRSGEH